MLLKTLSFILLFFFYFIAGPNGIAQCPDKDIVAISTQGQLDSFKIMYPDCESLDARLEIADIVAYGIQDLSGISNLKYIRELTLHSLWALKNLSGLDKLEGVEKLEIAHCYALSSIDAIDGLHISNTLRLEILDNLLETCTFMVSDSMQWISINNTGQSPMILNEIYNLNYVELLQLDGKLEGTGLAGLKKVDKIRIYGPINGFKRVNDIFRLIPNTDFILDELSVSGIDSFSTNGINARLKIHEFKFNSVKYLNFSGIGEYENSIGSLDVSRSTLVNQDSLKNLQVDNTLSFSRINDMETLPALKSGTSIQRITLINMENLVDISAINNFNSIESVWFRNNPKLEVCHYEPVCRVLRIDSLFASIQNNAPGCASLEEVEAQCMTSTYSHEFNEDLYISPNPVSHTLQIMGEKQFESTWTEYDIFGINGQVLQSGALQDNSIDVSSLQPGMYFLVLERNGQVLPLKFVKE
jgi:hypothetical protein